MTQTAAIGDSWYAASLAGVIPLDEIAESWPAAARWAIQKSQPARGAALYFAGRHYGTIVTTNPGLATKVCLLLCAASGQRKLVLLEYIVHPPSKGSTLSDRVRRTLTHLLHHVAVGRAVRVAHVLSETDPATYAAQHGLPASRFRLIPWPQTSDLDEFPELVDDRKVMASGRRVDWNTFFAAAAGSDWDCVVVCSAEDAAMVGKLRQQLDVDAAIHVEISQRDHQQMVHQSSVYVIPVPETGSSIGHVRVMNAIDAGVPVVASDVAALRGYLDLHSAVLVPPGDPDALREAVSRLLTTAELRDSLRRSARARASFSMDDYLKAVAELVAEEWQ